MFSCVEIALNTEDAVCKRAKTKKNSVKLPASAKILKSEGICEVGHEKRPNSDVLE